MAQEARLVSESTRNRKVAEPQHRPGRASRPKRRVASPEATDQEGARTRWAPSTSTK